MGRDGSVSPQLCCSGGGRWELGVCNQILLLQALWQTLHVLWQSCDQRCKGSKLKSICDKKHLSIGNVTLLRCWLWDVAGL